MSKIPLSEYGAKCGLCGAKRRSRIYYKLIKGRWLRLCPTCWENQERAGLDPQQRLTQLTKHVDAFAVECDGSAKLVHLALWRAKQPHVSMAGVVVNADGEVLRSPHCWTVAEGLIIDYRLQMWLGPDAPHGVFKPADHPGYVYLGHPIEFDLPICALVEHVCRYPIVIPG
jgi:hypothetical protein